MTKFFASNRDQLITKLNGGIIVVSAYAAMQRSNDTAFTFEQEANFWWLTGIELPDWWLIIDGTRRKTWLAAPTLSRTHEIFDGSLSPEEAKKISGVDDVISQDDAKKMLRDIAKRHSVVYTLGEQPYAEYLDFTLNPAGRKMQEQLERTFNSVQDCRKELAKLRAIKQPEELARMKKAVNLTVAAFEEVKAKLTEYSYEYEVEAEFSHYFRKNGARGHSFDPIVASGKNTCTLHYLENNSRLKKRTLLLLDIGARYEGYSTDIARTYSLGEPTKRQQEIHAAVQAAHAEIFSLLGPDLSVEQYQRDVDAIMIRTLMSVGLLKDKSDTKNYRKYFPHAIGHGLGIDPHDSLGGPHFLQPNMVLTVEPGIYIPEEGIGVRIEDDILITEKGHLNLSGRLSTDL
ncbi:MAG TPA: Xaa-Pro peptidase family protein [Verrucomicrobiae bacterium]|nr:Xaa-Pro peptidase family protein [Verrucomicrobiae bacterium]